MRTEEWTKDIDGMISTGIAVVHEPGDLLAETYVQSEQVMVSPQIFEELMTSSGWSREKPHAAPAT